MARPKDKQRFLQHNRFCCICGGSAPATTVEHCPPLSLYIDRKVKGAGYFPSCKRCNEGSKEADQIVALSSAIMASAGKSHMPDSYIGKLISGVQNNSPEFFNCWGNANPNIYLRQDDFIHPAARIEIDRRCVMKWLGPWSAKATLAFWYRHTGRILPSNSGIFVRWFFNSELEENASFFLNISAKNFASAHPKQGKEDFGQQFYYRYQVDASAGLGTFLFIFHESAAVWTGVFEDRDLAFKFSGFPTYSSNAKQGVYQLSEPLPID